MRLPTTKPRLGPGGNSASLYCDTMPHIATRANGLSRSNTAACTAPPTFSKYASIPFGHAAASSRVQIERAVIDAVVEAQAVLHPQALLRSAGHADNACAGALGELASHRADRAGRGGNHHGLALFRLADLSDAAIRRRARHAEHAEIGRQRRAMPRKLTSRSPGVTECVCQPRAPTATSPGTKSACAEAITSPTVSPGHHVARVDRLCVGLLLAQPAAHIGVDRQPDRPRHHLATRRLRHGVLADLEILPARRPVGTSASDRPSGGRSAAFWLIAGSCHWRRSTILRQPESYVDFL